MRATIIVPNAWAAANYRFQAASLGNHGAKVMALEHAVARLAGGFKKPVSRVLVLDALKVALKESCPAQFADAVKFPGLVRALAGTLMKVWAADLSLPALAHQDPRIRALSEIEAAVLKQLPPDMLRHGDLKTAAMQRLHHAPKVLGDVTIVGRTEMSPVWREFVTALAKHVSVTWDAGTRQAPTWLDGGIKLVRADVPATKPRYVSCADAQHEVMEALRWARGLVTSGKAKPHEIAICTAAPQAYDGAMAALSADGVLPLHFIHGRAAVETRDGQEAAALADLFLGDLSLQGFRRLATLGQGPAWKKLPDGWMQVLPREASLANPDRWRAMLDAVTDWPGGADFSKELLKIIDMIAGERQTAPAIGEALLGSKARAIWARALLEGPPDALLTSLASLAVTEDVESLSAVAWGSAAAIASSPRPQVWMLGVVAGSWPRGIAEDPLLPSHRVEQLKLDPLPVADADRRDFGTLLGAVSGELVVSRARRDVEGRELGISSLWPVDAMVEALAKSRAPLTPFSEGDRLASRPFEFKETPAGAAALATWRDWHRPEITAHDGRVRPNHPLVIASLARPMSASSISIILTNPVGWMFREVLSMKEPDIEGEPFRFDPLSFGNLVHGVIERAIQLLGGSLGTAPRPAIEAAVATASVDVAKALEIEVPVPPARLWTATILRAREMALTALVPTFLKALPGQRSWAEVPFGKKRREGDPVVGDLPWDPEKGIMLAGVEITGKVDRLDLSGDGRDARVIDWKTGRVPDDVENWNIRGGREVQRSIYAGAVVQLAGAERVQSGLAYLRDGASWMPSADAVGALQLLERRLAAMREAVRAGLLLPGPGAGDDYDDYSFALPGDAKIRYLTEKGGEVIKAMGAAAEVWGDP
jgi:hypothetical protein